MRRPAALAIFAVPVFVGAWLTFAVQPMVGKVLLPWFGGGAGTWSVCLFFFQALLVLGYAYAHLLEHAPPRLQLPLLLAPWAVALAGAPPLPEPGVVSTQAPDVQLLGLLVTDVGLAYGTLAATAPLLQVWYERAEVRAPYRLYAVSNAGSVLGLLTYPLLLEPLLTLTAQARVWRGGFVLWGLAIAVAGWVGLRARPGPLAAAEPAPPVALARRARWLVLSALPSAMLVAITQQLTLDVAPTPLLWVVPLLVYLGSFVAVYWSAELYRRPLWHALWALGVLAAGVVAWQSAGASLGVQVGAYLALLLVACVCCHGELALSRPPASGKSGYYLTLSVGGAAGGLFASILAPRLFDGYLELPLAMVCVTAALFWVGGAPPDSDETPMARPGRRRLWLAVAAACLPVVLSAMLRAELRDSTDSGVVVDRRRNFFGVVRVTRLPDVMLMTHGRVRHGMQFHDPQRAQQPTMYFGRDSAVGRVLTFGPARSVAVVGLGVGTLASHGRAGDRYRFFEINPDVVELAREHFSFLERARARVEVEVADGRLGIGRAGAVYDIIVLDAFSSDAVPSHLLSVEAFALYLEHLRQGGLVLANVSNRHLHVDRVVVGSALAHGLAYRVRESPSDVARGLSRVRWAVLARDARTLEAVLGTGPGRVVEDPVTWTDERSDLLEILR